MTNDGHRWLVLTLEAPLLAFGGVRIDHIGITRDFPALSMLTGMLANALGYHRTEWEKHQALQDRLIFAARIERENPTGVLLDMQNAMLEKNDKGWTTRGQPEGRAGASYGAPHRRERYYHMDARVVVVLRLEPATASPDIDALAHALHYPKRPIFIGRKPCLPTGVLVNASDKSFVTANTAYEALQKVPAPPEDNTTTSMRSLWPLDGSPVDDANVSRIIDLPDLCNWRTGLHSGTRKVVEGRISPERMAT